MIISVCDNAVVTYCTYPDARTNHISGETKLSNPIYVRNVVYG